MKTFREKDFGNYFNYQETKNVWALGFELPHEIHFSVGEIRYGRVLKTVAYICIAEDDTGSLVLEKWQIKHC